MKAFYWAILATLVWGVAPIIEKIGLVEISPLPGVVLRSFSILIGSALILLFNPWIINTVSGYSLRSMLFIFTGGFLASIVGSIFFYNALKTGEASKVVPVAASFPLISFVLGIVIFHEGVTITKLVGMGLVISGVYLLK